MPHVLDPNQTVDPYQCTASTKHGSSDLQTKESGFGLKGADITEAKRRTVAIVDDDHAVLDSLPILLEVVGHAVEIFASAGRIGHHPTDELLHGLAAFGRRSG